MQAQVTAALEISEQVEKFGAYAGLASILGLAVLSLLYFGQARELKRLREWAGRAPERAAEMAERAAAYEQQVASGQVPRPGAAPAGPVRQAGTPLPPRVGPAVPVGAAPGATAAAAGANQDTQLIAGNGGPKVLGPVREDGTGPLPAIELPAPAGTPAPAGAPAGDPGAVPGAAPSGAPAGAPGAPSGIPADAPSGAPGAVPSAVPAGSPAGAPAPVGAPAPGAPVAVPAAAAAATAAASTVVPGAGAPATAAAGRSGAPAGAPSPGGPGLPGSGPGGPGLPAPGGPGGPGLPAPGGPGGQRLPDAGGPGGTNGTSAPAPLALPADRPVGPVRASAAGGVLAPRTAAGAVRARPGGAVAEPEGRSRGRLLPYLGGGVVALAVAAVVAVTVLGGGDDADPRPAAPAPAGNQLEEPAGTAAEPTPPLDRSQFSIRVLNGTTIAGVARTVNDRLERRDYRAAAQPTNAAVNNVPTTTVAFSEGNRRAANDVARILGVAQENVIQADEATRVQGGGADVIVTVGADKADG